MLLRCVLVAAALTAVVAIEDRRCPATKCSLIKGAPYTAHEWSPGSMEGPPTMAPDAGCVPVPAGAWALPYLTTPQDGFFYTACMWSLVAGQWCPADALNLLLMQPKQCEPCPAGSWGATTVHGALGAPADCICRAPAGSYCGTTNTGWLCPAGQYCTGGTAAPKACPVPSSCLGGATSSAGGPPPSGPAAPGGAAAAAAAAPDILAFISSTTFLAAAGGGTGLLLVGCAVCCCCKRRAEKPPRHHRHHKQVPTGDV